MAHARHSGRTRLDDDKKFEFSSPDTRRSDRSASHRYFPADASAPPSPAFTAKRADDHFSSQDFKARWWPAPDSSQ